MNTETRYFCFLFILLLTACGGSSSTKESNKINSAPLIVIDASQTVASGATVVFEVNVSDPDGDTVEVTWHSENENVDFSAIHGSSVNVSFSIVSTDQLIVITITAEDSKGNKSQQEIGVTLEATDTANEAPLISMATQQQARGGESIVLIASIQDLQGDDFTLEWQTDDNDIVFSDKSSSSPTVTLPEVVSNRVALLTLVATDSQNNSSEKVIELTIIPSNDDVESTVYIELLERFDTLSGDTTVLSARVTSNVDFNSLAWDLTSLNVADIATEILTTNNITNMSATFTAPSVSELTEFPISIVATTASNEHFSRDSRVYVSAESTESLVVSLPNSVEINEDSTTTITPTIESSHSIDSYQWQWLSEQELNLLTPDNEILSLAAPRVDADIVGQLTLTVTMGQLSKTVTTQLTIKNDAALSEMNYTISRLVAVKGQAITFNVISEDYEQIKEWSWETSGVQGTKVSESNRHFEVIAPSVSGQQTLSIIYRAKLVDNSEILKIANVTILSEAIARTSLSLDTSTEIVMREGAETRVNLTFTDRHGLVDKISLDTGNASNTFDLAEVSRNGDQIQLKLRVDNFILSFNHTDYLFLNVNYGDYQLPFFIEVEMKTD